MCLGFIVVLLLWPEKISRFLCSEDACVPIRLGGHWERRAFSLGTRIIGLSILAKSVPSFLSFCSVKVAERIHSFVGEFREGIMSSEFSVLVSTLVAIVLGLYLLSGGGRLAEIVFAGHRRQFPGPPPVTPQGE